MTTYARWLPVALQTRHDPGASRNPLRDDRWFALLVMTRLLGAGIAIVLLIAHTVTGHDAALAGVTAAWTTVTLVAFGLSRALRAAPLAWGIDTVAALGLVLSSEDWRSPLYVFALTTLVLPAATLPWRPALAWGGGFSAAYALTALLTRQVPSDTLLNTIRLETLATHLFVPMLVTLALAYAGELLSRLQTERERSERLAIQTERQRIAWELHDSAKQRVHAAHLLLSALDGKTTDGSQGVLAQALGELRGATADMETSIAELRTPVDGRPVAALLRERVGVLAAAGNVRLDVEGELPELQPTVAAHTYRIVAEAVTNAVRHSGASTVHVKLSGDEAHAYVLVEDDGVGLDLAAGQAGHGLRSMQSRAETIGARLRVAGGASGRGTSVALTLPIQPKLEAAS